MAMFVDSQSTCLEILCSWLNIEKVQWTCDKNFVCGNILTVFFIYFFKDQRDKIMICSIKKASTSTNQKKKKKKDYK